MMVVNGVIVRY